MSLDAVTAWLLTDPSTDGSARPPPPAPVAAEGFKTRGEFVAALLARVKAECEGVLAGARRRPPPVLKCPLARHDTIPRASRPRPTRTIAPRAIFHPRAQTLTFIVRRRVSPRRSRRPDASPHGGAAPSRCLPDRRARAPISRRRRRRRDRRRSRSRRTRRSPPTSHRSRARAQDREQTHRHSGRVRVPVPRRRRRRRRRRGRGSSSSVGRGHLAFVRRLVRRLVRRVHRRVHRRRRVRRRAGRETAKESRARGGFRRGDDDEADDGVRTRASRSQTDPTDGDDDGRVDRFGGLTRPRSIVVRAEFTRPPWSIVVRAELAQPPWSIIVVRAEFTRGRAAHPSAPSPRRAAGSTRARPGSASVGRRRSRHRVGRIARGFEPRSRDRFARRNRPEPLARASRSRVGVSNPPPRGASRGGVTRRGARGRRRLGPLRRDGVRASSTRRQGRRVRRSPRGFDSRRRRRSSVRVPRRVSRGSRAERVGRGGVNGVGRFVRAPTTRARDARVARASSRRVSTRRNSESRAFRRRRRRRRASPRAAHGGGGSRAAPRRRRRRRVRRRRVRRRRVRRRREYPTGVP